MNKKTTRNSILVILNFVALLVIFQFSPLSTIIFEHKELHSTLDGISAIIALIMVLFLYRKRKEAQGGKYAVLAMGFLAMGIILLFIAVSTPGEGFRLLHNTQDLIVSILFALIWIPTIREYVAYKRWVPWFVGFLVIIIGMCEIFARDSFPEIVNGNVFTDFAVTINYLSGALYLILGLYFAREYYRLKKTEDMVFGLIIFLFFLNSLASHESHIWTLAWWGWHAIQIVAISIVLAYIILDYLHTRSLLLISENKYQKLFDNSPDGIIQIDSKANIIDCNQGECKLLGYKKNEIVGKHISVFMDKEALEIYKRNFPNLKKEGHFEAEMTLVRKDGTTISVWRTVNATFDESGNFTGAVANTHDITNRKQDEENLRITHDYLENLINYANAPIMVWDSESVITRFNHAFEYLSDYKADEVVGKRIDILFPDSSIKESLTEIEQSSTGERWESVEIPILRKDGKVRIVLWNSATLYESDGKTVSATIAQGQDITKRKRAELELTEYRNHLEGLVKERTSQLEEANKELDSFSHSVSHDLRAPLRAIDGFTRILIEDYASKLDTEGKRLGSVIQDNAKKMGKLIDDLLSFSRSGRAPMSFSNIDMKNMVNSIYHEVTDDEERKRVKLTITDLPKVEGDTVMMRQVWINLISNAVKFSSKRKQAVITVSCKEEKDKLIYSIKDNGAGFDMKYVDKLFGVFQRLHGEKDFEGTGVGLSLVQRIIRRHNGTIWAESSVDKGAEFYFSLPKKNRWIIE